MTSMDTGIHGFNGSRPGSGVPPIGTRGEPDVVSTKNPDTLKPSQPYGMPTLELGSSVNQAKVMVGNLTFWFSFQTCVALCDGDNHHVTKNRWGSTTGAFLNILEPDKTKRLNRFRFEQAWKDTLSGKGNREEGGSAEPNGEAVPACTGGDAEGSAQEER